MWSIWKPLLTICCAVLLCDAGFSQSYTLSGQLIGAETNDAVSSAHCYDKTSNKRAITNSYGHFKLELPAGKHTILFSHVAYKNDTLEIDLKQDTLIQSYLFPREIAGVEIVSNQPIHKQVILGKLNLSPQEIKSIPTTFGEVDIFKSIAQLPGVTTNNNGQSGIFVRGGGRYGNQVLIDNIPVYSLSHGFGFISMFDDNVISDLDFYKGGFPARYGDFTSSLINIHIKEGNKEKIHGEVSPGLIKSKFMLNGPIGKKLNFIVAARTTNMNPILYFFNKIGGLTDSNDDFKYNFYDVNAKLSYNPNTKHKVWLNILNSKNRLKTIQNLFSPMNDENEVENGMYSRMLALQHFWFYNSNITINNSISWTGFRNNLFNKYSENYSSPFLNEEISDFNTSISSINTKSRISISYFTNHQLQIGLKGQFYDYKPIKSTYKNLINGEIVSFKGIESESRRSQNFAVFLEDEYMPNHKLSINGGIRLNLFTSDKTYLNFEPRISLRHELSENLSYKVSYADINQNFRSLDASFQGIGNEIYLMTDSVYKPVRARIAAAGFFGYLPKAKLEWSAELYYKHLNNISYIKYLSSFEFIETPLNEKVHNSGIGKSYGLEVFMKYNPGKRVLLSLSYTLSRSTTQLPTFNKGLRFVNNQDRTHDISLSGTYKLNKNKHLNFLWVFNSGTPITLPIGYIPNNEYQNAHYIYGENNNQRLPPYHRLDISYTANWVSKRGWEKSVTLSLYNAYIRVNPVYIYFKNNKVKKKDNLFVLPSISYTIKF